jgi:hypothetical protein
VASEVDVVSLIEFSGNFEVGEKKVLGAEIR